MKKLLISLILFALVLTPLAVMAQDEEQEMETFTSEDGLFTLMYPADWFVTQGNEEDLPFPNLILANSEEAATRLEADDDPVSGDKVFFVMIIPTELLTLVGTEIPEEPTIVDLTNAFAEFWSADEEDGEDMEATEEAAMELGEAEEIDLGDDLTAGTIDISDDVSDGVLVVREISEGLLAIVFSAAVTGEYEDDQTELAQQIAASIEFSGTAEDVMNDMMGVGTEATEEAGGDTGALDGDALVSERCTVCHTRERIDEQDKDEAGWTETVDRMIGYGAELNEEEREAVIQYLVETH